MFKQILEIVLMNLRTIPQRLGASLVIVIGIAGVVGVFTALFAMAGGIDSTLKSSGDPRNALVLRGGSQAELNSSMDRDTIDIVRQGPGIRKDAEGKPLVSGELIVIAELPKKGETLGANITLRGIEPAGFALRPNLKIVEGRQFTPGLQEVVVGKGAAAQFEGLAVGGKIRLRGADWDVVGMFASGDSFDSEIFTDSATAQTAWGRPNYYSVALVGLDSADGVKPLHEALDADPRVNLEAKSQVAYFTEQTASTTQGVRVLGSAVAVIMCLGAIFAALNTMYASVSTRTREIATLRAIGFGPLPVVASVLVESMLLALAGGVIGAFLAYVLFNGMTVSTLGGSTFTQLVFDFKVSPALVATGLQLALAIGFIGGLLPALRAARMPVTVALREA
ncbi:MAG: ABC transporter permease [Rhodanobacteraceae bacterium]|nr:ABC transporter permease [Rhodanobacteraceae bacterium]